MDVESQLLKHLTRDAQPTVSFIDKYCSDYKDLFPEVKSAECTAAFQPELLQAGSAVMNVSSTYI
jgi:hypothetical protein